MVRKSFNDMVKSMRKGWTRYIDPNTGEEIFTPGRDDEASAFDYSQSEPKQYPAEEREGGSRQIGDITIYYDFITSYDTLDGYITGQYIEVKSMDTPFGHTDEVRNAKGFATHIFDFDEGHQVRISVKIDEDTIDEFYSPRYSFFKRGTELWTVGSNGYSIEAKSYDELLSLIEYKDELLKDRDYDDEYDEFASNLPDRIEQNGYDMYYHNSDSEFITYLNNGKCNIELTIFPDDPPDKGYFTIEEYDISTMSWELVAEDYYYNTDDLLNKIKEKLNDMPGGS